MRRRERKGEGEWASVGREETRERESGLVDGGWEKEEMETSI
jgi:hypothetical protein